MECSVYLVFILSVLSGVSSKKPHIIFIIADDLGWNDVGFHGSNQIPTPNIDALAYSGVILNNYYVNHMCTPSRSALMTGKYPIHMGYWTGFHDYYSHIAEEHQLAWGFDMRRGMEPAMDLFGKYSTDIFNEEAVRLIKSHNTSNPMFLLLSHIAPHNANRYELIQAPDEVVAAITNVENYQRRKFAGVVKKLDDSVGDVMEALSQTNMLEDSIVIFTSDNGGPAAGVSLNYASNWPLRGGKETLWEGGVRGAALIWSKHIKRTSRVANQTMHITDWLPTLYTAVGGNLKKLAANLDAIDVWESLSQDLPSKRKEVLHNIDEIEGGSSLTIGQWKVVKGTYANGTYDSWFGEDGRKGSYNITEVIKSKSAQALSKFSSLDSNLIIKLRETAEVKCGNVKPIKCEPVKSPCLFNIAEDPCELRNLADAAEHKSKLDELLRTLSEYNKTVVPAIFLNEEERANPKYFNGFWTPFDDPPVNHASVKRGPFILITLSIFLILPFTN